MTLLYMVLMLPLGILYFTWAVTGVSLSAGLAILIIGVPFMVLFVSTVYALSLVEGRLVETLLGERMPRRPQAPSREAGFLNKVKEILADPRTWMTLLYMVLMLPLGILYFTAIVTLLSLSFGLTVGAVAHLLWQAGFIWIDGVVFEPEWLAPLTPLLVVVGVLMFFGTLHLARGVGRLHGALAKHMLVRS
jgi:hypothetical protein